MSEWTARKHKWLCCAHGERVSTSRDSSHVPQTHDAWQLGEK